MDKDTSINSPWISELFFQIFEGEIWALNRRWHRDMVASQNAIELEAHLKKLREAFWKWSEWLSDFDKLCDELPISQKPYRELSGREREVLFLLLWTRQNMIWWNNAPSANNAVTLNQQVVGQVLDNAK